MLFGRMWVKKLLHNRKLKLTICKIGLVVTMFRRKVDIPCLEETKWGGENYRNPKYMV